MACGIPEHIQAVNRKNRKKYEAKMKLKAEQESLAWPPKGPRRPRQPACMGHCMYRTTPNCRERCGFARGHGGDHCCWRCHDDYWEAGANKEVEVNLLQEISGQARKKPKLEVQKP